MTVSYIIKLVAVALRTGAIYNELVELPESAAPEALITILEGGCDCAPARYPMATEVVPWRVEPAPEPMAMAFIPL